MQSEKPIIFFDGICNLCNAAINFIIDRDKGNYFKFAPLQSSAAEKYIPKSIAENTDSIIYWDNGKISTKSTAALKIAKHLDGFWKVSIVFFIVPKFLRDIIYDFIAKFRYKWFGRRENCRIPTQDIKNRFIEID